MSYEKLSKKQLSVHWTSLKKRKQSEIYDELTLENLMRYYGFQTRDELMKFLENTCSDLG